MTPTGNPSDTPRPAQSSRLNITFRAGLLISVVSVVGIALAAGYLVGAEPGSFADWIAAVSTLAAFAAAVVAANFAADASSAAREALQVEQDRDDHRDELELRTQAELVAAWADYVPVQQIGGTLHLIHQAGHRVLVRNASALPITQVMLTFTFHGAWMTSDGFEIREEAMGVQIQSLIPPDKHDIPFTDQVLTRFNELRGAISPEHLEQVQVRVGIEFTDAGSRRWSRPHGADLVRADVT